MTHVVFNEPDVEILKKAIELDETLAGNVLLIRDDYAVGPLTGIFLPEGLEKRRDWWRTVLQGSDNENSVDDGMVNDPAVLINIKECLINNSEEELWIWASQNKHDVCGYYWLMSQLKPYQGRLLVLYLNNLPFLNDKGQLFYPTHLSEIQPKEFLKAKKLARPITLSEFEIDPDEWKKLCQENEGVRFLEGGKKLVSMPASFYDKDILSLLTKNAQKLPSALAHIITKMKVKTGDAFIVSRLKVMAEMGKIVFAGNWQKGWKDIVVQMPGGSSVVAEE